MKRSTNMVDMKMYAVLRNDIYMSAGKAAAQAGHAFVHTTMNAQEDRLEFFHPSGDLGTRVVLGATHDEILEIIAYAKNHSLPHYIVVDREHIFPPHFDGNPILTAVGIGPLVEYESEFLAKYDLYETHFWRDLWRRVRFV